MAIPASAMDHPQDLDGVVQLSQANRNMSIESELHRIRSSASRVDKARHRLIQRKADAANIWPSGPPEPFVSIVPIQESWEQIWQIISAKKAQDHKEFIRVYCSFARPPTLDNVLNWRRTWSSWSYEGAYPCFSQFLKRAEEMDVASRCSILVEDVDIPNKVTKRYLFRDTAVDQNHHELWETIKQRPIWDKTDMRGTATATVRLMQIIDLSPMVLSCILGSTPKYVQTGILLCVLIN